MRGGSSIFQPSTGPKVLKVPRRPVPKGLGENAFFARLRPVGASNKQIYIYIYIHMYVCAKCVGVSACVCFTSI